MTHTLRSALLLWALMTVLLGFIYPMSVSLGGWLLFPEKAKGSLLKVKEKPVGSSLIGQNFTKDIYFWGRPSATSPFHFNAQASGASHFNIASPKLTERIKVQLKEIKKHVPENLPIPIDLVTTSASGLDPHISPEAARIQISRVAKARHMDKKILQKLVSDMIELPTFSILGQARINVLKLNLELNNIDRKNL